MKYYDGRFLIYDSVTRFKASELTEESLEEIGGTDAVSLRVHEATGLVLPFMKKKALTDPNNFNIAKWFEDMIANSSKTDLAIKGITKRLTTAGVEFTPEDVEAIVNVPLEADAKKNSPISTKLLEYAVGDAHATTVLRRRVMVDDVPYKAANKTYNQVNNTDTLGIRLPDSDVILSHTLGEPYADTPFQGTYSPYPNRLYRTKQIVSILTSATPEIRLKNINNAIEIMQQLYKEEVPREEIRKLQVAFELLPLEYVIGNPDNDTVDIFPNEQEFYNNLIDFIKYHIHKFNKEVMVTSTEEEIKAKSEQDFEKGVLPVRLTEYLDQLLYDVTNMNFYHTGNFNYVIGDLQSDDGEMSDAEAENDKMGILVAKDDPNQSDLNFVASSYLGLSARTFSASVWAEGIVKLMRWGDRKIKNLNVGVNNTQYLDLQKMTLVTQQLADLSQFEVDKDEQGRTLDILATSFCDFTPQDAKRAQSYPFLLVGREYGYIPGVQDSISVTYITTLFDIVRAYKLGEPSVYDLTYTDGKFVNDVARENLVVFDLADLNNGSKKIKISEELTDYAIDNNITKMQGTAFSFLRESDFEEYKSTEPLMERLVETPKPMRSNVVQGALLSIFQEGAQNYDNTDIAELLNWYAEEVYPIHEEAFNNLFGFTNQGEQVAGKLNTKNLKTANFFGQGTKEEPQEELLEFMYPIYEGEELTFNKIVRSPKDDTIIGGYAALEDGSRVFASVDEVETYAVDSTTVHTGQVLLNLFEVMLGADTNNGYTPKHKVISGETVFKLYKGLSGK